jgi:hypothetical protein
LGRKVAVIPPGHDRKELAKRIVAHLLTGTNFVAIDNLEEALGGADLCSVLTEWPINLRRLGHSEQREIDAKLIVIAGGNGVKAVGDMTRRSQTLCIDWGMVNPEQQDFPFNPFELALQMRGELLAAGFTIIRAYIEAGMPGRLPHIGSFEEWSDLIRSALVWLGEDDPAVSMTLSRKNDARRRAVQRLALLWLQEFVWPAQDIEPSKLSLYRKEDQPADAPEGARTLQQIVKMLHFDESELKMAMQDIAPGTGDRIDLRALGRCLGGNRAPFELTIGIESKLFRFASKWTHDHTTLWWLEEFTPQGDAYGKCDVAFARVDAEHWRLVRESLDEKA